MMASRTGSRRYYVVGESSGTRRPRFDPSLTVRDNVVAVATWEWGDRRAQWAGALADELGFDGRADEAAEWVAAVLCAAAIESGRDRRTGWSRTLTALSEMTGVPRDAMLARHAQLGELRPTG